MKIGKSLRGFSLSVVIGSLPLVAPLSAEAQITPAEGPVSKQLLARPTAGDDKVEMRSGGCTIRASMSRGCDVILCKGEEPIRIKSASGIQLAKQVADDRAHAMQRSFIEQFIEKKRNLQNEQQLLAQEGLSSEAQLQISQRVTESITRQASGMLRGIAIEEDGITESAAAGQYVAYVITKTSCRTQAAAAQSGAAMSGQSTASPSGPSGSGPAITQNPTTLNPVQRRGGGLD